LGSEGYFRLLTPKSIFFLALYKVPDRYHMTNNILGPKKKRHFFKLITFPILGTASAKEFYKRNHQWTEGLISAAKSVAQGANFLV
jgi:hypothetical protein